MLLAFGCAMYRRRRLVLVVWALVVLLALPFVPRVFRSLTAVGFTSPDLEAFRAAQLLVGSLRLEPVQPGPRLRRPERHAGGATDPRFLASGRRCRWPTSAAAVSSSASSPPPTTRARSPPTARRSTPRSTSAASAGQRHATSSRRSSARSSPTPLQVTLTGAPVFYQDIFDVTERDLRRAELLSIPTAAIALVIVFGSVVAGVVPGLVGGTAVALTLALMVRAQPGRSSCRSSR